MTVLFSQSTMDQILAGGTAGSVVVRAAAVLLTGVVGLFLMLPRGLGRSERMAGRWLGAALCGASLVLMATAPVSVEFTSGFAQLLWPIEDVPGNVTFFLFGGISLASAVMMITSRNPVYSALWFAVVLLSNSGLYFLQGAEFLAASTIIVYAGAIIVTFLFVIMLAQPRGAAPYDRRSREPLFTCVAGLLLSAALVGAIHFQAQESLQGDSYYPGYRQTVQFANAGDVPQTWRMIPGEAHVRSLGRTLYLDHVVSVEVIGLLLLAAVVGAMLIAGHKIEATGDRPQATGSSSRFARNS